MPSESSRQRRVAEQIQREIARLIQQEVKDPRVGMVTVSAVEVTRDMSYATVYVTVMGDESQVKPSLEGLEKAAGFLRRQLSHVLTLRSVPTLRFRYDQSVQQGNRLASLIDSAVSEDRQHQKDRGEGGEES